jgi:hypothetical protein
MFDTFRDLMVLEEENATLRKEVEELKKKLEEATSWVKHHQETECDDGLIGAVVQQAEVRGAAWACNWHWQQGLRHIKANPYEICKAARSQSDA